MSTADKKRAATLAGMFNNPTPVVKKPAITLVTNEPDQDMQEITSETIITGDDTHVTPLPDNDDTAVARATGVMGRVITLEELPAVEDTATDDTAQEEQTASSSDAAAGAHASEVQTHPTKSRDQSLPTAPTELLEAITTQLRLKGLAQRMNIDVSEKTFQALGALDTKLALSGRAVVSRNALIEAAARRVIANPHAYENTPLRPAGESTAAVQGRIHADTNIALRAACYTITPRLVRSHALEQAITEILGAIKKVK